jgi:beta-galactosidase
MTRYLSRLSVLCTILLGTANALGAELPRPMFYLPLEGSTTAAVAGGSPYCQAGTQRETILTLVDLQRRAFREGKVGQGFEVENGPLVSRCDGNFRPDEGTACLWLSPKFRGDDKGIYCTFFGAGRWGMLYKYETQSSLTFGTAKPEGDLFYNCGVRDISAWRPGQWHHLAVTWSRKENVRRIYVDGKPEAGGPFAHHADTADAPLYIGAGCLLYPQPVAHAVLDEVAIWDRALDDATIAKVHQLGQAGEALWDAGRPTAETSGPRPQRIELPKSLPEGERLQVERPTPTRETASLNGWWQLWPSAQPVEQLPGEGWGRTQVPGYWATTGPTRGSDGQPVRGRWGKRPVAEFPSVYHLRTFQTEPAWGQKAVFLQLDGVDGLGEVFWNGQLLGRLPAWEGEAYDVGPLLTEGKPNTLVVAVHRAGDLAQAGIYGNVSLRVLPQSFIHDVVVQPQVAAGKIRFSCDLWHATAAADARMEIEVTPDNDAMTGRVFSYPCRLKPADRSRRELSAQTQRVEETFAWNNAHLWTYDDPFLYRLQARLKVGGQVVDESPVYRFGFREMTVRGSEILLNGKPTHLRGHQIDTAWGDQFDRVRELKAAGMNAMELAGPVSHTWYLGTPYRGELFEKILDYADRQGIVAIPVLPAAEQLKDRIFEPGVAELYRRRIDKHIRRYGNHPSIGMWFMNFNLAGYHWYHAPTKIDGSYKPDDKAFLTKERYSLEAERIARQIDPRPLYHHACGNFGAMFTLNGYLGPTCPLQEREEWPSRWAAKRPFPLIAAEHCLMLIPYWFRPRQFPLSVVYAGEPLFDELSAKFLGRRAYGLLTPELFDRYDIDRKPRGNRTRDVIRHHSGYQEVKSIFASRSLRAWRTYGVSGIIFNAVNWDFKDDQDRPLPVMQALARYFNDTDLYIAGPGEDWPSKDHSFFAGETVRKQIVLLNDLTRDLPCQLRWRLEDAAGKAQASGELEAVAQAGRVTMVPVEFVAPKVETRQRFRLAVTPEETAKHFLPEQLTLEVFPRTTQKPAAGRVLVYDPAGETIRLLAHAGVAAEPLEASSRLAAADLVVVGKKAYGKAFETLAKQAGLDRAVAEGLNLVVFEQTAADVFGLELREQSTRQAFLAEEKHPLLAGLAAEDLCDFRGASDLVEPYPEAAPETQHAWPKRYFKWGNRGVVATYVYRKPHYAPFVPILECGFDLVDSPLMEAQLGRGRVVVCQLDVTSRYGVDPVATRLVDNLLNCYGRRVKTADVAWAYVGASAKAFLGQFGITAKEFPAAGAMRIVVGREPLDGQRQAELAAAASRGATVVLLPGSPAAEAFGLQRKAQKLFIGRLASHPLLAGLGDGDLYLKQWREFSTLSGDGWQTLVEPGLVAVKPLGQGQVIACSLDLAGLEKTRARVKLLRFWNILLANLGGRSLGLLDRTLPRYEPNEWEEIPPFMNW